MVSGGAAFLIWLSHESRAFMNTSSAFFFFFQKRLPRESLLLLLCEDTAEKMEVYEPGKGPSLNTESVGSLILDLSSRTVRIKCCLVVTQLWYFVRAA